MEPSSDVKGDNESSINIDDLSGIYVVYLDLGVNINYIRINFAAVGTRFLKTATHQPFGTI